MKNGNAHHRFCGWFSWLVLASAVVVWQPVEAVADDVTAVVTAYVYWSPSYTSPKYNPEYGTTDVESGWSEFSRATEGVDERMNPNNSEHRVVDYWVSTGGFQATTVLTNTQGPAAVASAIAVGGIKCYWKEELQAYVGFQPVFWGSRYVVTPVAPGYEGVSVMGPFYRVGGTLVVTCDANGEWVQLEIQAATNGVEAFRLYPGPFGGPNTINGRFYCLLSEYDAGNFDPYSALKRMGGYGTGWSSGYRNKPGGVQLDIALGVGKPYVAPTSQPTSQPATQPAERDLLHDSLDAIAVGAGQMSKRDMQYAMGPYGLAYHVRQVWDASKNEDPEVVLKAAFGMTELGLLNLRGQSGTEGSFEYEDTIPGLMNFDYRNAVNYAIHFVVEILKGPPRFNKALIKGVMFYFLAWWFIKRSLHLLLYALDIHQGNKMVEAGI